MPLSDSQIDTQKIAVYMTLRNYLVIVNNLKRLYLFYNLKMRELILRTTVYAKNSRLLCSTISTRDSIHSFFTCTLALCIFRFGLMEAIKNVSLII